MPFEVCCEPFIEGVVAPTAEALMRSRYTAITLGKLDHIENTCTPSAVVTLNRVDMERSLPGVEWLGLEILGTEGGQDNDDTGVVSFVFRFMNQGKSFTQREKANFVRVDGNWLYDGSVINPKSPPLRAQQTGRNDPCPCDSGRKYKKCCGAAL